jgi:calcineurin-like phosphoesterase family protein
MINTWFTSDSHFGHKNILEFEPEARPFKTLEEMHEVMIDRWNSCVGINDIVYHLGDFCFGKSNLDIATRLNGKKRLTMGNHDMYPAADYLLHFEKIMGVSFWKMCILSHVPVHPNNLGSRAFLNVHGHLHSKRVQRPVMGWHEVTMVNHPLPVLVRKPFDNEFEDDENYFNVSVEQNNLTPFHADQILERLKEIS